MGGAKARPAVSMTTERFVGFSRVTSGYRAFLWTASGGIEDIGPGQAFAINDMGHVVGTNGRIWLDSERRNAGFRELA